MLKLNPYQQRLPVGGHQYYEHGTMFRGETFDEVKDKLTQFRLNNGLPMGDPEQQILTHYAKNWPYMVKGDAERKEIQVSNKFVLWREWVLKTWRGPPKKVVTQKEADIRSDICASCPYNTKRDWEETDESDALKRRVFIMHAARPSPKTNGFCSCHLADLNVLVFLNTPKEHSSKKDVEQPKFCWVS